MRIRKHLKEVFGRSRATGGLCKTRYKGIARVDWVFILTATAYSLVRLPKLTAEA